MLKYIIPAAALVCQISDAVDTLVSVHADAATCDAGTRGVSTCDSQVKVVATNADSNGRFFPFVGTHTAAHAASTTTNAGLDDTPNACQILTYDSATAPDTTDAQEFIEVLCLPGGAWIATVGWGTALTTARSVGAQTAAGVQFVTAAIAAGGPDKCGHLTVARLTVAGTAVDDDTAKLEFLSAAAPTTAGPWMKVTGCPTPAPTKATTCSSASTTSTALLAAAVASLSVAF